MLFKIVDRLIHAIVFIIFLYFSTLYAGKAIASEIIITPEVFINEIHYDNQGADQGEFVELAGIAGINLLGWSLHFYNGNTGTSYKKYTFDSWLLTDEIDGYDFAAINISGIQNGESDGIVLADADENIVQFLSYEGRFTALAGIAVGLISDDIGIDELSSTPIPKPLEDAGFSKSRKGQLQGID